MSEDSSIKKIEIFFGVLGLFITGILGYGQWELGERQNEILRQQTLSQGKLAVDQIEIQTMDLVSGYLGNLTLKGEKGEQAEYVVLEISEFLSEEHGRENLAKIARRLISKRENVSTNIESRIAEATVPVTKDGPWYTVLASYHINEFEDAKEKANTLLN